MNDKIIELLVSEIAKLKSWKENSQQLFNARNSYAIEAELLAEIEELKKETK